MIPLNPLEHQKALKALYSKCMSEICIKHKLTQMELDILLFLANNPAFDTATDIVEIRYLAKSQVSSSIKCLVQSGYLKKEYINGNHKTAHLKLCETAADIIRDGKAAQEQFLLIMMEGFSQEELDNMRQYSERINRNINSCLKEGKNNV